MRQRLGITGLVKRILDWESENTVLSSILALDRLLVGGLRQISQPIGALIFSCAKRINWIIVENLSIHKT